MSRRDLTAYTYFRTGLLSVGFFIAGLVGIARADSEGDRVVFVALTVIGLAVGAILAREFRKHHGSR